MQRETTIVKFLSRLNPAEWQRYFSDARMRWGDCQFTFERDADTYDWFVVYDDLPPHAGQNRKQALEHVRCHPHNTVLITTEPESIKTYGKGYTAQFGHVLTSQPAWALPHPRRHYQHAANHWFYGSGQGHWKSHAEMLAGPALADKTRDLSCVFSPKQQTHTLHAQRLHFIQRLTELLPDITLFGRGAIPMDDKAEALAPFRYHVAVENHVAPHHITEKLTDAFLGRCLPFYAGAPNATDYFPADSFIPLDIHNPDGAARVIADAIRNNEWARRLPAIDEARRRVLERENLFAIITRIIEAAEARETQAASDERAPRSLYGRHAWRTRHPIAALGFVLEKLRVRLRSRKNLRQSRPA